MGKSIVQLARIHGLNEDELLAAARRLAIRSGKTMDRKSPLTAQDERRLLAEFDVEANVAEPAEVAPAPSWTPLPPEFLVREDKPGSSDRLAVAPKHPLFVHLDIMAAPDDAIGNAELNPQINHRVQARVAHRLRSLGARGRTGRDKSTKGAAHGWIRAPLGGNGGSHFYLWWAKRGSPALESLRDALPPNAIAARIVRHHDDVSALDADPFDSYAPLQRKDVSTDAGYLPEPWTPDQLAWSSRTDPVRILKGTPGTGKTTCLQLAVERRSSERVLYITLSERLRDRAREEFGDHRDAADGTIDFMTIAELIERITGERGRDDLAGLRAQLERLPAGRLREWKGHTDELVCELRAHLVGAASPSRHERLAGPTRQRVADIHYLTARQSALGVAAEDVVAIADTLDQSKNRLAETWFGSLHAAFRATLALLDRSHDLPWLIYDRVVIDEVQDLTVVEASVLVELVARLGRQSSTNCLPFFLLAGDEGQTVHAAGFDWGWLKDLISDRLGVHPHEQEMDANLRSPARIGALIDSAGDLYALIEKRQRPAGKRHPAIDETAQGKVRRCKVVDAAELERIVAAVDEDEDCAVIILGGTPAPSDAVCLTPAAAKGLEFETVVILDAGAHLANLHAAAELKDDGKGRSTPRKLWLRREIDSLRVALSRTSGDLIFVETAVADTSASGQLDKLLADTEVIPTEVDDLVAELGSVGDDLEIRLQQRIDRAREFIEHAPMRAWRLALSALRDLGAKGLPGAVEDERVRREVKLGALVVAIRLLDGDSATGALRPQIAQDAPGLAAELGGDALGQAVALVVAAAPTAVEAQLDNARSLATKLHSLQLPLVGDGFDGLNDTLARVVRRHADRYQRLLRNEPEAARRHLRSLGTVLAQFGVTEPTEKAEALRLEIARSLKERNSFAAALEALATMGKPPVGLRAELLESLKEYEDAARDFRAEKRHSDAMRCWRSAGNIVEARRDAVAADDVEATKLLDWLSATGHGLRTKPPGALTEAELRLLRGDFDKAAA